MFILIKFFFDIIFILLSYVTAYLIKFNLLNLSGLLLLPFSYYWNYLLIVSIIYLLSFYFWGLYKSKRGFFLYVDEFIGVLFSVFTAWIALIVFTFFRGEYEFARPIILRSFPLSFLFILISREIILRLEIIARAKGYGAKKASVIGSGELAKSVADKIKQHPSYGFYFVGFINGEAEDTLGNLENLEKIIDENNIKALYVTDKTISREKLAHIAALCDEKDLELGTIPDVFQILTTSPSVEDIDGMPIVKLKHTRFTYFNRLLKRAFDFLLSLFGIIVFSLPIFIFVFLVKFLSPGAPSIYAQDRVGLHGKIFKLYKLRTMIPDAEKRTGPVFATEDDTRKTPIGKILRSTNLDELPQLFNILKGDMSFVGPRPERPVFVEQFKSFIPKYMDRHQIRPGLAGWAQLHGGYNMPTEEKIKYDLYYIENWSFLLDIKIIIRYILIAFTFQRRN